MNPAFLYVILVVLALVAILGWLGYIDRGKRNDKLRAKNELLEAAREKSEKVEFALTFKVHGRGTEPVTIVATKMALYPDQHWKVIISWSGGGRTQTFSDFEIQPIDGVWTLILRNPGKPDKTYPGIESMQVSTR